MSDLEEGCIDSSVPITAPFMEQFGSSLACWCAYMPSISCLNILNSFQVINLQFVARKELAAECQLTYQEVKILTCGQYPSIIPRNKKSE